MKPFIHALVAAGLVGLALSGPRAEAGRIGGPASETATVPAHQSMFFDVPLAANEFATITVVGRGNATLELYVHDADGNVTTGSGSGSGKTAVVGVYRSGMFRVEVRNIGPAMSTAVISVN
jgi:hypothetical protein